MKSALLARIVRALDSVRAVRDETKPWVYHLTGEGPATLRRQRAAVAACDHVVGESTGLLGLVPDPAHGTLGQLTGLGDAQVDTFGARR